MSMQALVRVQHCWRCSGLAASRQVRYPPLGAIAKTNDKRQCSAITTHRQRAMTTTTTEQISTAEDRCTATKKWLDSIVIQHKLCPFAAPVRQPPKLRIHLVEASQPDDVLPDIINELHRLVGSSNDHSEHEERPETTLCVLNEQVCPSFRDLIHLSWRIQDECINEFNYTSLVQQVLFHPQATHDTYAMGQEPDAADYTIRSPFPIIHLLREVDVLGAVDSGYPDLEGLPTRNKTRFRRDGVQVCAARLADCYKRND